MKETSQGLPVEEAQFHRGEGSTASQAQGAAWED